MVDKKKILQNLMAKRQMYLMIGIPVFALFAGFLIFSFIGASPETASAYSENNPLKGVICLTVTRADGTVEDLGCKHNIVYNDGLEMFEDSIAHGVNLSSRSIILCNETASGSNECVASVAAQTEAFTPFIGCGLDRNSGNGSYATNPGTSGNWSIYATFTNSCAGTSQLVNASKLGHPTTARNFSGATFSSVVTLAQNDQLTVNWTLMGTSG